LLSLRLIAVAGVVALIAATAIPLRGRTCDQWLAARLRFRRRLRSRPRRASGPVEAAVSGVDTRGHADRAGNRVGLVTDGQAWTAVFRLDPLGETDLVPRLQGLMDELSSALTLSGTVHSVRVAAVQLVGWAVPAGGTASIRTYWVALRFRPTLDPGAVQA